MEVNMEVRHAELHVHKEFMEEHSQMFATKMTTQMNESKKKKK